MSLHFNKHKQNGHVLKTNKKEVASPDKISQLASQRLNLNGTTLNNAESSFTHDV